jgi:hypothetical protein
MIFTIAAIMLHENVVTADTVKKDVSYRTNFLSFLFFKVAFPDFASPYKFNFNMDNSMEIINDNETAVQQTASSVVSNAPNNSGLMVAL